MCLAQLTGMVFTVVCAWCNTTLQTGRSKRPSLVSHGICPACTDEFLADALRTVPQLHSGRTISANAENLREPQALS